MAKQQRRSRELTGRHVLMIAVGAFAVILTANIAMVMAATGSFPGLVAKNSFVASQDFNLKRERQDALGWRAEITHEEERLLVTLRDAEGAPIRGLAVRATAGRPADARSDQTLDLAPTSEGYAADAPLAPGKWRILLEAENLAGDAFEVTAELILRD